MNICAFVIDEADVCARPAGHAGIHFKLPMPEDRPELDDSSRSPADAFADLLVAALGRMLNADEEAMIDVFRRYAGESVATDGPEWAVVEIMGHRRHGGTITEVERFGAKFIRIDVPGEPGKPDVATHYYSGPSIFSITPCDEKTARRIADQERPRPAAQYRLEYGDGDERAEHES